MNLTEKIGFDWDDGNFRKNEKHGVHPIEIEQVFANRPVLIVPDAVHSIAEERFLALGTTDDARQLAVVFTLRESGSRIRPISARPMNRKERAHYEKEA
jgi:hypothetical protein